MNSLLEVIAQLERKGNLMIILAVAIVTVNVAMIGGTHGWYTRDEGVFERIRGATENYTYQSCSYYPNIQRDDFGGLNVTFIKYDAAGQHMFVLFKTEETLRIWTSDEVPFKYLIQKGDEISFLIYCHPQDPVLELYDRIDMATKDKNGNYYYYTVVRITWHSMNYKVSLQPSQMSFLDTLWRISKYLYLSCALLIIGIAGPHCYVKLKARCERSIYHKTRKLMISFWVAYLFSIILYTLRTDIPWLLLYAKPDSVWTQAEYITFVLLSSFAMIITFEIGLGTEYYVYENEKPLLLAFATLITFVSVIVTFVGGLLTPTAPTLSHLLIPVRMTIVIFGAILGLNSFLLGILGRQTWGIFGWIARIFVIALGSLFSIVALAYTESYPFSTFSGAGMIVLVGSLLFLRYDKWRHTNS